MQVQPRTLVTPCWSLSIIFNTDQTGISNSAWGDTTSRNYGFFYISPLHDQLHKPSIRFDLCSGVYSLHYPADLDHRSINDRSAFTIGRFCADLRTLILIPFACARSSYIKARNQKRIPGFQNRSNFTFHLDLIRSFGRGQISSENPRFWSSDR